MCVCLHGCLVFYFDVYVPIISCIAATFSGAQFLCVCTCLQTQKLYPDKLKFGIRTHVYICNKWCVTFFRSNIWGIHVWQRTCCHLQSLLLMWRGASQTVCCPSTHYTHAPSPQCWTIVHNYFTFTYHSLPQILKSS